jgi:acyl-CoA thioesterase FadM
MEGAAGLVETYRGGVDAWECDVFGHLNIAFYVERLADAGHDLLERLAPDGRWRTVAIAVGYERELRAGEGIVIRSAILEATPARVRIAHEAVESAALARASRAEHVLVPVKAPPAALAAAPIAWEPFPVVRWPSGAGQIAAGRDRVKATDTEEWRLTLLGYLRRFSTACLHVIEAIGMNHTYRSAANHGFATFDTRLAIEDPTAAVGDGLVVTSGVVSVGRSSLAMVHRLRASRDGRLLARFYQAGVHFDLAARRSSPWPAALRAKASSLVIAGA